MTENEVGHEELPRTHVVRLWDMFDGWIDVHGPCTHAEALDYWNKKTDNGTHNTQYADGDYWAVYEVGTRMVFTPEAMGR